MADAEVWDPRASAYQRTLLASLRSHVLDPSSLASGTLREQVVAAFAQDGPEGAQSVDLFESAALCALEDADLILFEAFLWNTTKRPYRVFPTLKDPSRLLTATPRLGVPLVQLIAGFCRLDILWEWKCAGLLAEPIQKSLRFYFSRPRFPNQTPSLPSSIPSRLELLCCRLLGGIEGREGSPAEWPTLTSVRETKAADSLARVIESSALGTLWCDTIGPRL